MTIPSPAFGGYTERGTETALGRMLPMDQWARRRRRIQEELIDIERLLDQMEVAIQTRLSSRWQDANGQLMADGAVELLHQHLNQTLGKCQDLQAVATDLEASDSGSRHNREISNEYAMLGVEIVSHEDRAAHLLRQLSGSRIAGQPPSPGIVSQVLTSIFACSSLREGANCGPRCWRTSPGAELGDISMVTRVMEKRDSTRARDCDSFGVRGIR
mmetsp:Transcript_86320/g.229406  ORF Transcript_86320/g.229406 Transcript_86320/m.229406 type:complete len:215 (-) Transcript_86320:90-734(-)